MTTETTAGAETAGSAATGETEATLDQMQANDGGSGGGEAAKEPTEPVEKVKEEKVVPLAALHEERNARKELQRQIAESQRKQAERDALIERRLEALANPPRQVQVPDKAETPVDYLDHKIDQLGAQQKAILEQNQQRDQEAQKQAVVQQLQARVIQAGTAFGQATPDFGEALKHLNSVRARELISLGASEQEASHRAQQELDHAAMQWAFEGRDPAQIAYEFAKARGYTAKAQQQQQQTPAEKIEAQKKGTAAARSLGGGGAPNAGKLTAEALANMSDEEFSKLTEAQFQQAMGG